MPEAENVTVDKLNPAGEVRVTWTGRMLRRSEREVVLEATFTHSARDLGYVRLGPGDRFVEYYYTDRWYNVMAIYNAGDGVFKGWYCNVTRPAQIDGDTITSEDLELDLFVAPDRVRMLRLDLDEFAARGFEVSDPPTHAAALAALDQLEHLAQAGMPPFDSF